MPTMRQPGYVPRIEPGDVRELRRAAKQELQKARRRRDEAEKYYRETAVRARSEAQQLILKARLAVDREVAALVKKASEEVQKVLADIRVIRITAQEELAAQRKFTDAARLCSMSLDLKELEAKATGKSDKKSRSKAASSKS